MGTGQASQPCSVSIIMPVFNRLPYLRCAVASVFAQSIDDWELIIADDGSGEETRTYLAGIARMPRVRVLFLSHSGNPGAVRNAALRIASGQFIAFLDSDDEWMADKLALQLEILRRQSQSLWCYSPVVHVDAAGNPLPRRPRRRRRISHRATFERVVTWEAAIAVPTVMVNRELLERVGGFDERQLLHEDYDLWMKLARESEVSYLASPLTRVRHHDDHYSRGGEHELRDWIALYARWQGMLKEPQLRRVVERQGARCRALLARHHAGKGDWVAALRTIGRGFGCWTCPEWWFGSAVALARLLVPTTVINASRRYVG